MNRRKPLKTKKAPIGTIIISLGLLASVAANIFLIVEYKEAADRLYVIDAVEGIKKGFEENSAETENIHYIETTYRELVERYANSDWEWEIETPLLTVEAISSHAGLPDILRCFADDPSQSLNISCPEDSTSDLYSEGDIIQVKGVTKEPYESMGIITPNVNANEISLLDHTTLETTENEPNTLTFEDYALLCVPLDFESAINNPAAYRDAYVSVSGIVVSTSIDSLLGSLGMVEVKLMDTDDFNCWVNYYHADDPYRTFTLGQRVTFYAQLSGNTIRETSSGYRLVPSISARYYTTD